MPDNLEDEERLVKIIKQRRKMPRDVVWKREETKKRNKAADLAAKQELFDKLFMHVYKNH